MKISIRSTQVLSLLAVLALALMMWVEFSTREEKTPHFEEKKAAAERMQKSLSFLKEKHFKNEINLDNLNDPNDTRLVGRQFSLITSGRGSLPSKLSCFNPNMAALAVDLLHEADVEKGDMIAVCATGSFPAVNIAVACAAETMGLDVYWINSVTSSSWGANDPEFTYLDIHASLHQEGLISNPISAASIGGNHDLGQTLSPEGRKLAIEAIERNELILIKGNSLEDNVETRLDLFKSYANSRMKNIQAFVNIGGGVASLGSSRNGDLLKAGYLSKLKVRDFEDKIGVSYEMTLMDVPVINFHNISQLLNRYRLPIDPVPLPEAGEGELFFKEKYDYRLVLTSLLALLTIVVGIIVYDKKQNALGNFIVKTEDEQN
jgi:poly-gamma-glutamate system protein